MSTSQRVTTNLLLGVTGGIAAYKACDLVSRAVKDGFSVRVVMTRAATEFVGPLSFEALSGNPVMVDARAGMLASGAPSSIDHIAWAKWAHVAVIAPLTANTMAKLAHGLADDALSTVWMALPAGVPSLLCPAMNTAMWNHPATQRNRRILQDLGLYSWVDPVDKRLACGDVGVGGLADPVAILRATKASLPAPPAP